MNLRPSGYEPDELPGCSTPRYQRIRLCRMSRLRLCFSEDGSVAEQIAEGDLSPVRDARGVFLMFLCSAMQKGRLWRPFVSAGPRYVNEKIYCCVLQTWQRPTLPRLETKYHWRWGVSRPCSERERVQPPRDNHQVGKTQRFPFMRWKQFSRSWEACASFNLTRLSLTCPFDCLAQG